jgi:ubiquinone/menaquinone biosynthesis C-methylase UbiE
LHRALVVDFRKIVERLPLSGAETVVDVGCGDGFFTGLLAERLPTGLAIGLDTLPAYLRAAGERLRRPIADGRIRLVEGDANQLPFAAKSVGVIWSCHSMQSYTDIPQVLLEFRRKLEPGGLLAILETDGLHSVMLSWPPDLELAALQAEHRKIGSEDTYIGTYFPRFAPRLLLEAGYVEILREYFFVDRQPPCDSALERYVQLYLENLLARFGERLAEPARARLRELASPQSPQFLPRQQNFTFGSLQVLITARTGGPG